MTANATVDPRALEPAGAVEEASAVSGVRFAEFYGEHFAFVWRNAQRLLGADAEADDVAQEVFVIAFRRVREFEGRSSPRTWLFGILRNVVSNHKRSLRRRNIRDSVDLEAIPEEGVEQHRSAERAEALRVMHELLEKLDDQKREAFILAELEQMTAPEIAEATGTNVTTVYARLRDARQQFAVFAQRYRARQQGGTP